MTNTEAGLPAPEYLGWGAGHGEEKEEEEEEEEEVEEEEGEVMDNVEEERQAQRTPSKRNRTVTPDEFALLEGSCSNPRLKRGTRVDPYL